MAYTSLTPYLSRAFEFNIPSTVGFLTAGETEKSIRYFAD